MPVARSEPWWGPPGFFEDKYQGQVNGALAKRSPGSTLKPFLYALAMDLGLIVPESYLLDVPTDIGGYVAENYDRDYRGRVTASDALIGSLNTPAVRLLSEVGVDQFLQLLRQGGITSLDRPRANYGLSVILGGCEVSLLELANLYASLAEHGIHRPVRIFERDNESRSTLLSIESAHLTGKILTDVRRPDLPESWELARNVPAVAWKTGTSYGHRDAWAVGYSSRLTIGVWVGNFDGRGVLGISGSEHAGPLLFDLFRALEPNGAKLHEPGGLELGKVDLCAESRQRRGPYCGDAVSANYLPKRSRLRVCNYHRRALVDDSTGELLMGDCLEERSHRPRTLTFFPEELRAWWRTSNQAVPNAPRLSEECSSIPSLEGPQIASPQPGTSYLIQQDVPMEYQKIKLVAQTGPSTERLYWYQDGLLIGAREPDEPLFVPLEPGRHRMVVVDNLGLSDSITYEVRGSRVR